MFGWRVIGRVTARLEFGRLVSGARRFMQFMPIPMADMFTTIMAGADKHRRRAARGRIFIQSRRLDGRNEETWEGVRYVRPPVWTKNILRKRYLA